MKTSCACTFGGTRGRLGSGGRDELVAWIAIGCQGTGSSCEGAGPCEGRGAGCASCNWAWAAARASRPQGGGFRGPSRGAGEQIAQCACARYQRQQHHRTWLMVRAPPTSLVVARSWVWPVADLIRRIGADPAACCPWALAPPSICELLLLLLGTARKGVALGPSFVTRAARAAAAALRAPDEQRALGDGARWMSRSHPAAPAQVAKAARPASFCSTTLASKRASSTLTASANS